MDILDRLLAHNEWATRVLLERCIELPPQDFNREFAIGPGTLHRTFAHIIIVMNTWANMISTDQPGERRDLSKECSTPGELLEELKAAHALLNNALKTVRDENRLDELAEFVHPGTKMRYRFTRGSIATHVLTHGMHHRAQVLNMLRHLGVSDLPDGDVLEWEIAESVGSSEPADV